MLGDAAGLYASALAFMECPHFDCYGPMTLARFDVGGNARSRLAGSLSAEPARARSRY
jgi:hypothetical protein